MFFLSKLSLIMLSLSYVSLSIGMEQSIPSQEQLTKHSIDTTDIKLHIIEITKKFNLEHNLELTALMCTLLLDGTKYMHLFGEELNTQNVQGDTALLLAVRKNLLPQTNYLLQANADISIKNKNGETALIIAREQGNNEMETLLVKALKKRMRFFAYMKPKNRFFHSCNPNNNSFDTKKIKTKNKLNKVQTPSKKRKRTISNEFPFPCFPCKTAYETLIKLKKHNRDLHSKTPYCCTLCSKTFTTSGKLGYHRKKDHHISKKNKTNLTKSPSNPHFISRNN